MSTLAGDKDEDTNPDGFAIASPQKKARASVSGIDDELMRKRFGGGSESVGDLLNASKDAEALPKDEVREEEL